MRVSEGTLTNPNSQINFLVANALRDPHNPIMGKPQVAFTKRLHVERTGDQPRGSGQCVSELDRVIGRRIHDRRVGIRMSQTTLGNQVGVTFQQIQKYERGVNRASLSRLCAIAEALGLPINFFIAPQPAGCVPSKSSTSTAEGFCETQAAFELIAEPGVFPDELSDCIEAYSNIGDAEVRRNLLLLMHSLCLSGD